MRGELLGEQRGLGAVDAVVQHGHADQVHHRKENERPVVQEVEVRPHEHPNGRGGEHGQATSSHAVREPTPERATHQTHGGGDQDGNHDPLARAALLGHVGERVDGEDGENGRLDHALTNAHDHAAGVLGEHFAHRRRRRGLLALDLLEFLGVRNAGANDQADDHEHGREQEGYAPAPGLELFGGGEALQHGEERGGQQHAGGRTDLGEGAEQPAQALGRVFHGEHRRTAPLHAGGQPLRNAAGDQQGHGEPADLRETRQQTDHRGGHAHDQQGRHQQRLTADPVTQVPGNDAAQGTEEERNGKGRERGNDRTHARTLREKIMTEHQSGGGTVQIKVVPLDGRAHEGRREHALLVAHRRSNA